MCILKKLKNSFSQPLKYIYWVKYARSQFLKKVFLKIHVFLKIAPI